MSSEVTIKISMGPEGAAISESSLATGISEALEPASIEELEAMAAGRPVVVSNVGGMPEVVMEEVGQLVDPLDAESIASGLKTYLGDAALRERVGMNARRFIEQHFDPRQIAAAYDKVYRRIAS